MGRTRRDTRLRPGFGLGGADRRRGALLAVVPIIALLVGVATLAAPPAQAADDSNTIVQTQFGPLTPADRDFLIKVRLAGLWEGPAGRESQKRSNNPLIREAGQHLIDGHRELDAGVLDVGRQLGVELPDEPTQELKNRLNMMDRTETPEEYDQVFVDLLRAAHGGVYQLLAKIRAGTRNSLIRQFSQRCMETVLDHMTVLENTGLVRWSELPLPQSPVEGQSPVAGMSQSAQGPLTMADRDFLVKVRLAGLWERPSGEQAQERSGSDAVKEAGQHLMDGHAELDATVLQVAQDLGVEVPDEPNADQRGWMAEMTNADTPQEYDQVFVARLRAAHGKVFGLVAQIRAGTRNNMIRAFSTRTMEVVLDHIVMLEATELVNFASLPLPPDPGPIGPVNGRSVNPLLVISILAVALAMTVAARAGRFYRI